MKVFISYSHKDGKSGEVKALVQWLGKQNGIEVISDHPHVDIAPEQGWQAWMLHGIEDADVVLCVCGEVYKAAAEKRGGGLGATWEAGVIITIDLYESGGLNEKYYPILPKAGDFHVVPKFLKSWDNNIALNETERILRVIRKDRSGEAPVGQAANKTETPAGSQKAPFVSGTFNAGRNIYNVVGDVTINNN